MPSQPAISLARGRLGPAPLAELFARACVPLAAPSTPGAFWRGRRLVSMDGTTLDVADTPENAEAFGRPGSGRGTGEGAYPQIRVVALAECGTHAMFAAAAGPYSTGEPTLARDLATKAAPGMLVVADRGFTAHPLFSLFATTGADLCWRAKANADLSVLERFPDGSYRSELVGFADRHTRKNGVPVRVVEYALDDPGRPGAEDNRYRLVTTMADPTEAPAAELAALYAERWEFESALDELKAHQRGPRVVLRSKTPEGARQEVWGYLCAHYALRALMATAAGQGGTDPDRVSFTRALHAARRSVRQGLGTAAGALASALPEVLDEVNSGQVRERRLRAAARVVKRKMSNYGVKRPEHRHWPKPTRTPAQAVRVLGA